MIALGSAKSEGLGVSLLESIKTIMILRSIGLHSHSALTGLLRDAGFAIPIKKLE